MRTDERSPQKQILMTNKYYFDYGFGWSLTTGGEAGGISGFVGSRAPVTHANPRKRFNANRDIEDGEWHHVAVTFGFSTGELKAYIDGEVAAEEDISALEGDVNSFAHAIGDGSGGGETNVFGFTGYVDDARIYRKALSAEEIATLASPPGNQQPIARAGEDRSVMSSWTIKLDGSASSDVDGRIRSYSWEQVGGAPVSIRGGDTAVATFAAPMVREPRTLLFELSVTDDAGAVGSDTIEVVVRPPFILLPSLLR